MQTDDRSQTRPNSWFKAGTSRGVTFLAGMGIRYDQRLPPEHEQSAPVLGNKFGITSRRTLAILEDRITPVTIQHALRRLSNQQRFGLKQLQIAHGTIMGPIYPWAGQFRKHDTIKQSPNTPFEMIRAKAEQVLDRFNHKFAGTDNSYSALSQLHAEQKGSVLARLYTDIYAVHPFLEGNGRANRTFISAISRKAGFDMDWTKIADRRDDFNKFAEDAKMGKSLQPLTGLFHECVTEQSSGPAPAATLAFSKKQAQRRAREMGRKL